MKSKKNHEGQRNSIYFMTILEEMWYQSEVEQQTPDEKVCQKLLASGGGTEKTRRQFLTNAIGSTGQFVSVLGERPGGAIGGHRT